MRGHASVARDARNRTPMPPRRGPAVIDPHSHHDRAERGIIARMARVMAEIAASQGSCDADDLAAAGFSSAEIRDYAEAARRLARRRAGAPDDVEIVR